jgi:gluconokinase
LYQQTGAPIHAAYALPQLLAWYQSSSNTKRVHRWQTIASVCIARWTGNTDVPISYSEASWTGLLNFRTCRYESAIMQLLPPACIAALPRLADFTSSYFLSSSVPSPIDPTGTTNPYWLRWPKLQNARLFLGVGDGACANLGSGCGINTGRIACTIGTSAAARVCLPCPTWTEPHAVAGEVSSSLRLESGVFCYRIDTERVLVGGALTDGGSALEWITNLLRLPMTSEDFQACLDTATERLQECYRQHEMPQESMGNPPPLVLPFWSGERSTGYRTGATGAILGLTLNAGAEDLIISTLEGVTLRLYAIVQLIRRVMEDSHSSPMILCSGKALERNVLWRTMLADCTGLPVFMQEETYEATSRGVAMLLRDVLMDEGPPRFKCSQDPLLLNRSSLTNHVPNESARSYWDTRFQTQEAVLEAMAPILYHHS